MNLQDAHTVVAQHVRAARTSFYWPMQLQPRAQREALFAIYAYCRFVDDIADGPAPLSEKLAALNEWRTRVTLGFTEPNADHEDHALVVALSNVIDTFDLPAGPFLAMIDGMETDVNGPVVAPSWQELETYCAQVAGSVGDLCLAVWGWRGENANAFAKATGEALQLTNVLRDIKDDAANGRVYLPKEALESAGVSSLEPADILTDNNLALALQPVTERAQDRFKQARALWPSNAASSLRPAWVMLSLYNALFNKVVELGVGPDRRRARLSRMEKVKHLASAYLTVP